MTNVEIDKTIRLEDLAEGKIFDESEVIICLDKNKTSMNTVRKTPGTNEIGVFMYDIKHNGKIVNGIDNNGYKYLYPENIEDAENWEKYNKIIGEHIR